MEADGLTCPVPDEVKNCGGIQNPVTGSHPIMNPDADPPCTIVVIGAEFVKTGSV